MKVVNLYGGPGAGKTATAWGLASELKKRGYNVEYVPEFAKKCVYENRLNILSGDQLYVLAKQHHDILTLSKHTMDFVIVDSPILISATYNNHENLSQDILNLLVKELDSRYENINILIERNLAFEYNPNGRVQKDISAAITVDTDIKKQLKYFNTPYTSVKCSEFVVQDIMRLLLLRSEE